MSSAIDQRAPSLAAGSAPHTEAAEGLGRRASDLSCRLLDIVGASLTLIVLSPLLGAIALLIKLDSRGPILFRQVRLGRDAKPFTVNKFRTMQDGVAHDRHREFVLKLIEGKQPVHGAPGARFKMAADQRVTRFGRLLRRSSLDELPQMWNVLRGEMSLVGPRPPIPYEVEHYPPHWFARFSVKPGVTGLWQVNGRSQVPLEEMVRLDVEYAHRRSFWLNLRIIVKTVPAVLNTRGAW